MTRQKKYLIIWGCLLLAILAFIFGSYILVSKVGEKQDAKYEENVAQRQIKLAKEKAAKHVPLTKENILDFKIRVSFDYYRKNVYHKSVADRTFDKMVEYMPGGTVNYLGLKREIEQAFSQTPSASDRIKVDSIEIAELDCGNDGVKEYALKYKGTFIDENSAVTFVVKDINDRVEVIAGYTEWTDCKTELSEYLKTLGSSREIQETEPVEFEVIKE